MQSVSIADLLLVIYVIVDDWYLIEDQNLLQGKPGKKPQFTDSEIITMMLAQDYIPYVGENQLNSYGKANYPGLITQSQYNQRAQSLRLLVEEIRWYWLKGFGMLKRVDLLLETKTIPVMGYRRSKK